jgi:hypothetical protein
MKTKQPSKYFMRPLEQAGYRTKQLLTLSSVLTVAMLSGCGGGASTSSSGGLDPLVEDFGIAYVKRAVPDMDDADVREPVAFNPGSDLIFRDLASPSANERNVTFGLTGGLADVKDVETSFDGSKLVFAMRMPEDDTNLFEETWDIWEYEIASDTLTRVISSGLSAEKGHDIAPHYLPDGRIIFSSTRQQQSKAVLVDEGKPQFSALDEDRNEHAFLLHVMSADGQIIKQVSFNQSNDLDPTVLDSGEVVFSRWDNMGNRDRISLYKMNPDGTNLQLFYGVNSHDTGTNPNVDIQFLQPQVLSDGSILSLLKPYTNTQQGGDIIQIDTNNFIENTQATIASVGMNGPAQTSASVTDIQTDMAPSPGGRFNSAKPFLDGTNRALVSWSPCRVIENSAIVPCTPDRLADPNVQEAPPLYSVFLYDMDSGTQLPIFIPQEGFMYSDVSAAQPRPLPNVITDKQGGVELDQSLVDENVGVLNIKSVYDFAGTYNPLGGTATDLTSLADPVLTPADQRPARFIRVVKAVSIPDDDTRDFDNSAFGRSAAQLMREIIGYAPIEPDGSVKIKVPANVPLAISLLDKDGKRIGGRHQNWLQTRPGEVVTCNGCHDPASGESHGRADAFPQLNAGAPLTGYTFPNTVSSIFADFQETMAEARTRLDSDALSLTMDIKYNDVWTGNIAANFDYSYADLDASMTNPLSSTSGSCVTTWTSNCRVVINYETHIHPLWKLDRGADTCTNCHTATDVNSGPTPGEQLDLTDGDSDQDPDRFKAYHELLFTDQLAGPDSAGIFQDPLLVQDTDANGNPLFEVDANGNPLLDNNGNQIPILVPVANIAASMSVNGALASRRFFDQFAAGGTHDGRLTPAELKLLAEWVDIGAQYYNNPFDAPE